MKNVFVYGSLMFEEVWRRIVKNRYSKHQARLSDHKRLGIHGQLYPGLVKSNGSRVDGVVYLNIKSRDLSLLDRFEGKYYQRVPVSVCTTGAGEIKADVYVFKAKYKSLLSRSEWDADAFRERNVQKFLSTYAHF